MLDTQTGKALHSLLAAETADLPPPPWTLIGEGVWGSVHDLGDGTVLKLTRRHGGLGSGEALHLRETIALSVIGGLATDYVEVPRLIAHGTFDNAYIGSAPPLAGWLRLTRLAGKPLSATSLYGASADARGRLGERIGAAIADFNRHATERAQAAGLKLGDTVARTIGLARSRLGQPGLHDAADRLADAWAGQIGKGRLVFIHGDLNTDNIIDMGDRLGFVDLAEAGWSLAEVDFRHLEEMGTLRDAVFRGYAARTGTSPDLDIYYPAVAANALTAIALHGQAGHPRDAMRRSGFFHHCMERAGLS